MQNSKNNLLNFFMLAIAGFTVYLQLYPPQDTQSQIQSAIYFIAILSSLLLFTLANTTYNKFTNYAKQIKNNTKDIKKIKTELETEKRFAAVDKKLALLEQKMNRKGKFEFDPRWLFVAFILILFYLYLRSLGIAP